MIAACSRHGHNSRILLPFSITVKSIIGEFMVFVDLEQDEEGQNPNGEVRNL